jgi:hypothetical protein
VAGDLQVTIDGADVTQYVDWEDTRFDEAAEEGNPGSGLLILRDIAGSQVWRFGQTVRLFDNGQLAWKGIIAPHTLGRDDTVDHYSTRRQHQIHIWDRNHLFDRRSIDGLSRPAETDYARVTAVFPSYRSNVDSSTFVISSGNVNMDKRVYDDSTLRDLMSDASEQSAKEYWIDREDRLHYLTEGQAQNWQASFSLSDTVSAFAGDIKATPMPTVFNVGLIERNSDPIAVPLQNRVIVKYTEKDPPSRIVVTDYPSIVKYGLVEGQTLWDTRAVTADSATDRGNAFLARSREPEVSYQTTIGLPRLDILYAGQFVNVTSAHQGLSNTALKIANWSARRKGTAGKGYWEVTLNLARPVRSRSRGAGYRGPSTPVPFEPELETEAVYAILYAPNNEGRLQYPHVVYEGDGDDPPSGYLSAPKQGPVEYVDKQGSTLQDLRWGIRVNGSGTVTVRHRASMVEVLREGDWNTIFIIKKNGAQIHAQITGQSCPGLCGFNDEINVTLPGITVAPGDLFTTEAYWTYAGSTVKVPAGANQGWLEIDGTVTSTSIVNDPKFGQQVREEINRSVSSNLQTNFPYLPGTLDVHAEGVQLIPRESNPSNGTFALAAELPPDTRIFVDYLVADTTSVGSNVPIPGEYNPIVPYPLLGSGGDGTGQHVLFDDGTWRALDDQTVDGGCGCNPEDPEDRALASEMYTHPPSTTPAYVQIASNLETLSGIVNVTLSSTPTPGNILLAAIALRDNTGVVPAFLQTGWTLVGSAYTGSTVNAWPMYLYRRTVQSGDGTTWGADLGSGGAIGMALVEIAASSLDASNTSSNLTTEPTLSLTPVTSNAIIMVSFVSVRFDSDIAFTPATSMTEILDDNWSSGDNGPQVAINYRVVASPTGSYTVGSTYGAGDRRGVIAASFEGTATADWSFAAPDSCDGDDTTYTQISGAEVLRTDLSEAYQVIRSRLRIGTENAGSRTYEIYGANESDFSDAVLLDSVTFTGTGSYTAQDVEFLWEPTGSYRYFQLDGTNETRRIYSWELYELANNQIIVTDPTNGDEPTELQTVLDNLSVASSGIPQTIFDGKGEIIAASAADAADNLSAGSNGHFLMADSGWALGVKWTPIYAALNFVIDGAGATITTGVKGFVEVPFNATIVAARLFADQSGSIVVDIWKDTYANYPPTDADSITASAVPTISSATKSEDTTLSGWTTTVTAGNILGFNVDSATTVQRVTVSLTLRRTV